jgi:hypothetical protein
MNRDTIRERLRKVGAKLAPITTAWESRKLYGQGTAAFLSVDATFSDIREAAEATYALRAALAELDAPERDLVAAYDELYGCDRDAPQPNTGSQWWLIYFADAGMRPEVFGGPDEDAALSEESARCRFADLSNNWNVTLFRSVQLPQEHASGAQGQAEAPK